MRFDSPVRLPNPFVITSNASIAPASGPEGEATIVVVEVIPMIYADQLGTFEGQQILAEIRLFGTTLGDIDVNVQPFVFPIELCTGCLTKCASELKSEGLTPEDVADGECLDNAGSDGRICIDDDC